MKKVLSLLLALALIGVAACTPAEPKKQEAGPPLRVASLKGPTTMGLVNLIADQEDKAEAKAYEFQIATAADEVTPGLIRGDIDLAIIPANLAAVLYNKSEGKIRVVSLAVGGVLNIVAKGGELGSLKDLEGKTIMATGKGTIPEYVLSNLLRLSGLNSDAVTIEWKSEPTEIAAQLKMQESGYAMLPEPFLTVVKKQEGDTLKVLDLNTVWKTFHEGKSQVTGVLVARSEVLEERPEDIKTFLKLYEDSMKKALAETEATSLLIERYNIVKAVIAKDALPRCGLIFVTGSEMKETLSAYLSVLYDANPAAVGGTLPGEDFYAVGID
jgi:NitT/TauT family transport system substrate-binding protein